MKTFRNNHIEENSSLLWCYEGSIQITLDKSRLWCLALQFKIIRNLDMG